jgi:hypothetical protein
MDQDRDPEISSLDEETPGSQGEVDPGSEGDFGGTDALGGDALGDDVATDVPLADEDEGL